MADISLDQLVNLSDDPSLISTQSIDRVHLFLLGFQTHNAALLLCWRKRCVAGMMRCRKHVSLHQSHKRPKDLGITLWLSNVTRAVLNHQRFA